MRNSIRKVLSKLHFKNYFHYKFFADIVEVLVNDKDEYLNHKGNIYDFLGDKTHEQPETIKTRLKTINNFDKDSYDTLGFQEKPKNTQLLDRIVELSKQEKQNDKVETTNEHKRENSE